MKSSLLLTIVFALGLTTLGAQDASSLDTDCYNFSEDPDAPGAVRCIVEFDNAHFAGGDFVTIAGQTAGGIARWNGTDWEPLPSLLTQTDGNPIVNAMCVMDDGTGNGEHLYVGGVFDGAGGLSVDNIARWNGTTWSRVDYGCNGEVLALAWSDDGGQPFLMAGGDFLNCSNYVDEDTEIIVSSKNIAMWYAGDWVVPIGNTVGVNLPVRALYTMDAPVPYGKGICIGGDFVATADLSNIDLNHFSIYRYGTPYESPAAGMNFDHDSTINAFTLYDPPNLDLHLFIGGEFDASWGGQCNLTRWDGDIFTETSGTDGPVTSLAVCESYYWDNPILYVAGDFTTVDVNPSSGSPDNIAASNIASWHSPQWYNLCPGDAFAFDCPDNGISARVNVLYPLARGSSFLNSVMAGGLFATKIWEPTDPVFILTDPQNTVGCEGHSASFTVEAEGTDLAYQWSFRAGGSGNPFNPIPNANSSTLDLQTISQDNAGEYRCLVSNVCGEEFTSNATLTVGYEPVISGQPYTQGEPCLGGYFSIRVDHHAVPDATWQWYHDGEPIESEDHFCGVSFSPAQMEDEGLYRVEITNPCGTETSQSLQLYLSVAPAIVTHPESQEVREGDSVVFSAEVEGSFPDLQWRKDEVDIEGAEEGFYYIAAAQLSDAGDYDMVAGNNCGTATTDPATLTVVPNLPPTAVVTVEDTWILIEQMILFDGSDSFDPEGYDLDYAWVFSDGYVDGYVYISYGFADPGVYTISLTVTDDLGLTDTDTIEITASDCQVEPSFLEFGAVVIDNTKEEFFTVTNIGSHTFEIDIEVTSDVFFVGSGGEPTILSPEESHTVSILFHPEENADSTCLVEFGYEFAPEVICHGRGIIADVDIGNSTAVVAWEDPVSVFSYPDGSRDFLNDCFESGGHRVDGTITLTLFDTNNDPIEGYPASEIWLESTQGNLFSFCEIKAHPDGPTDVNGVTTFSGALHTGGHSVEDELLLVIVDGQPLTSTNLQVRFNSPDLDNDGVVNLTDISLFTQVFFNEPQYSCDFNWDDDVNLTDVAYMAAAIGNSCDEGKALPGSQIDRELASSLGFFAEPGGTTTSLTASQDEPFTVYLIMQGGSDDLLAWECRAEPSPNLRILGWELAGQAINIGTAPEFNVGLGEALPAEPSILLATARCQVTNGQPATLGIAPAGASSFHPATPAILLDDGPDKSRLNAAGTGEPLVINAEGIRESLPQAPDHTALLPASPNPFNPQTHIRFELPASDRVQLVVYSIDGRKVRTLVDEVRGVGRHEVIWDGRDDSGRTMASGTYFYRLKTRDFQDTKRMVLIK